MTNVVASAGFRHREREISGTFAPRQGEKETLSTPGKLR
jgi:hypothetical protein